MTGINLFVSRWLKFQIPWWLNKKKLFHGLGGSWWIGVRVCGFCQVERPVEGSWLESWRMWSSLTSSSTPEIILITDPESFRSIAPCRAHLWGVEILARTDRQTHGWKHQVTYRGGTHLKKEPYKHSFNMLEHVFMSLNLVIAFNHPYILGWLLST